MFSSRLQGVRFLRIIYLQAAIRNTRDNVMWPPTGNPCQTDVWPDLLKYLQNEELTTLKQLPDNGQNVLSWALLVSASLQLQSHPLKPYTCHPAQFQKHLLCIPVCPTEALDSWSSTVLSSSVPDPSSSPRGLCWRLSGLGFTPRPLTILRCNA